jgi:lambda family phage holin
MHNEIETVSRFLSGLPEPIRAALLAALVALLRILHDGKEPRWVRRILEAALCGAIALGVAGLIEALGMSSGWATFLGASVGLFGADQVREWGRRLAEQRVR